MAHQRVPGMMASWPMAPDLEVALAEPSNTSPIPK